MLRAVYLSLQGPDLSRVKACYRIFTGLFPDSSFFECFKISGKKELTSVLVAVRCLKVNALLNCRLQRNFDLLCLSATKEARLHKRCFFHWLCLVAGSLLSF